MKVKRIVGAFVLSFQFNPFMKQPPIMAEALMDNG